MTETINFYYYQHNWPWNEVLGFVVENLVRCYYGLEPQFNDKPDDGYDLIVNGCKLDIKTTQNEYRHFDKRNSAYTINVRKDKKPLIADFFIYCKIDFDSKMVAIIGYNNLEEVKSQDCCRLYRMFEPITEYYGKISTKDCFVVNPSKIHYLE